MVSVLDRTVVVGDQKDLTEEVVVADVVPWLVPVLNRPVLAVDRGDLTEEVVTRPRLCVGACDCGSAVGSPGSWLIESSGSEGSLLFGFGGSLLLELGGSSLPPGGPVEPPLPQMSRPTVFKKPNSNRPKLVGGSSHVGKSGSMSSGFPSWIQTKPGGRRITEHRESVGRPPGPVEVQVLVVVLDVETRVVRTCDQT